MFPKFPNPFPTPDLSTIWDKAKKIVKIIFGKDEEEIKQQKSYNTEKSSASDIMILNKALNECRMSFKESFDELESALKKECQRNIDGILEMIDDINLSVKVCNTLSMKRQLSYIIDDIDGTAMNHMKKRISLDDAECLAILKLPAGDLKGTRMRKLKKKIYSEAIGIVSEKIRKSILNILENISDTVEEKVGEIELKADERKKNFEIISDDSKENISKKEEIKLDSAYFSSIGSLGEDILGGN